MAYKAKRRIAERAAEQGKVHSDFRADESAMEEVQSLLRLRKRELEGLAAYICSRHNRPIPWSDIKDEWERITAE